MIIVSGTKRSGTSMWMQILRAAGFPSLGDAFPHDWGETIRAANPGGFFESELRRGIYYATNPHPATGAFLPPRETRHVVVKVFATGLVKSDLAYVHRVIASMRPFREYVPSLDRLLTMEQTNRLLRVERQGTRERVVEVAKIPPVLEWWRDNYALIRDALVRRYPLHMISYESVLRDPGRTVSEALRWLGAGDLEAALDVVRPELRTQQTSASERIDSGLSSEHEALFDELYTRIDEQRPLDADFIDRLNEAQDALGPEIASAEEHAKSERKRVRDELSRADEHGER